MQTRNYFIGIILWLCLSVHLNAQEPDLIITMQKDWPISSYAYSPDGKSIAIGSEGMLKLYETNGGKCIKTFTGQKNYITNLVFTSDGTKLISSANDLTISIWDIKAGACIRTINHVNYTSHIALSHNGKTLAVSFFPPLSDTVLDVLKGPGEIKIWDMINSKWLKTIVVSPVPDYLAFSPDDSYLASSSSSFQDSLVKFWDITSGSLKGKLFSHTAISSLSFSPDGSMLASKSRWDYSIKIWNLNDATVLKTIYRNNKKCFNSSITISPVGNSIINKCGFTIQFLDLRTGEVIRSIQVQNGSDDYKISPDGRHIAIKEGDQIEIIDISKEAEQTRLNLEAQAERNAALENESYIAFKKSYSSEACINYIQKFPNGKHYAEVNAFYLNLQSSLKEMEAKELADKKKKEDEERLKAETELYQKAIKEGYYACIEYINKYPQGIYIEEVKANKKVFDDREALVKKNMNTALWKLGNRVCLLARVPTVMLVCGVLEGWNEDRSMAKIKLQSGMWDQASQYNGEDLFKEKLIWITPKDGWHICVQTELDLLSENNTMPGAGGLSTGGGSASSGQNVAWYETYTIDNSDGSLVDAIFSSLTNITYDIRYTGVVEQELGPNYKVIITNAGVDLGNWASSNQLKYRSYVNEMVQKTIGQTRVLSKTAVKMLQ